MNTLEYQRLTQVWQYLLVSDFKPQQCDAIFVLGRDDLSIPKKALGIYKQGLSSRIILLGGRGRLTGNIKNSESVAFKQYLLSENVPEKDIFIEEISTNTGENIIEGLKILKENNIFAKKICLVTHRPHMRRALAVAQAQDSNINWLPCPDDCALADINSPNLREAVQELIGEIDRLQKYPKLGYFKPQNIPEEVMNYKGRL